MIKTLFCIITTAMITINVIAGDKIKVQSMSKSMSQGSNSGLSAFIPEADEKDVEKLWKKYIKDYGGKTGSQKGEIFTDDANISQISANSVDVYAKAEKSSGGAVIDVFFDLGGAYLSSSDNGYGYAEKMVYKFAVDAAKDAVNQQLAMEQKTLKKLESDQKKLEKEKELLEKNIVKWQDSIKKAENDIKTNEKDQGENKNKIAEQQKVVETVETKLKDIK